MQSEPLTFEISHGSTDGTRVFRLTGPLVLQNIFDLQSELAKEPASVTIFDLTAVPYMDSAGMGVITNHYVSAMRRSGRVIVAGASPRVFEIFKITRVDTIIPMTATVADAEGLAESSK